jgi:perosamine synthetase
MEIARENNLKVIEDCAQSYLSYYKGRLVGTIGDYGCFSTNDFKHISTGDGGIITVNSGDETEFHRVHAFADKNYQRLGQDVSRDILTLAPNYRMTELQGAVGIAQLKKLPWICETRQRYGDQISKGITGLPGIAPHKVTEGGRCSYWFYMFRIDESFLTCTRKEFSDALNEEGIPNSTGYIPQVVYQYGLFQNKEPYQGSHFPFEQSDVSYEQGLCPNAEEILETTIRISVNEFFSDEEVEDIVKAIRKVAQYFAK